MNSGKAYNLKSVINARGTFTPLGVSRSSQGVADAVAYSLQQYFDMEELMDLADHIISSHCGAEAATIVNCASAAITLSVAAIITGDDTDLIAKMPDINDGTKIIALATGHSVNYGHPIEQDIRLAGCVPQFVGSEKGSTLEEFSDTLEEDKVTALLFVESRLVKGRHPPLEDLIKLARSRNIPVIIDAAAQDMRMKELVTTGADLIIFSAQKYLAAPTAGIVVGKRNPVDAVRAQGKGIGRSMKAGKEAIIGTIKAVEERQQTDMQAWSLGKKREAEQFASELAAITGLSTELVKDPSKGEFWRIDLILDETATGISAIEFAKRLQKNSPAIYCNASKAAQSVLNFEILALDPGEQQQIINQIRAILDQARKTRS